MVFSFCLPGNFGAAFVCCVLRILGLGMIHVEHMKKRNMSSLRQCGLKSQVSHFYLSFHYLFHSSTFA